MTGPEHYRLAEKMAAVAVVTLDKQSDLPDLTVSEVGVIQGAAQSAAAVAQVHATLAMAAATAQASYTGMSEDTFRLWLEVLDR